MITGYKVPTWFGALGARTVNWSLSPELAGWGPLASARSSPYQLLLPPEPQSHPDTLTPGAVPGYPYRDNLHMYPRQPSDSLYGDRLGRIFHDESLLSCSDPASRYFKHGRRTKSSLSQPIICPRCHSNLRMKTLSRRLRLAPTAMEFSRFRHPRLAPRGW